MNISTDRSLGGLWFSRQWFVERLHLGYTNRLDTSAAEERAEVAAHMTLVQFGGGLRKRVVCSRTNRQLNLAAGTSLGVGLSFALNIGQHDSNAIIANSASLSGANDISLSADGSHTMAHRDAPERR